jgi:hypothetical protein
LNGILERILTVLADEYEDEMLTWISDNIVVIDEGPKDTRGGHEIEWA